MSLNITLAGTIYNKNGDAVDAKVQVFVYNSNNGLTKWSDVRDTEDTDYNINLGDPDLSGNDNTLGLNNVAGEYALIAVWLDGSRTDKDNPPSELAFVVQEMKGDDVYLQDIMLKEPSAITCSDWTLPTEATTEDTIIGTNQNTNEFSYIEFDKEHFVYHKYFDISEVIFYGMGACKVEYDFGDGYSTSNVHTEDTGGDLEVKIKVQDCYGNIAECSKTIKIYYIIHQDFVWSPDTISKGDDVNIDDNSSGDLDQISKYQFEITLDETTYIDGSNVTYTANSFGNISIIEHITYFNGYENVTIDLEKILYMENIPPQINLEAIDISDNGSLEYKFIHNGTDEDGYIEKVKWEIWRNNPDINGNDNWNLYYTTGEINDLTPWEYNFIDILGEIKVISTVYDNQGASASQSFIIENNCDDKVISINIENVDWTKKVIKLNFDTKVNTLEFSENIVKIVWVENIIKELWKTDIKKYNWSEKIKKITFSYKNCRI